MRLSLSRVSATLTVVLVIAAARLAAAQLTPGGQTIGGPGLIELKAAAGNDEGMVTVFVTEEPLKICASVRPINGVVSGIYLGAGDKEGHFDIGPTNRVDSRTATVCRPDIAWVSIHCRGACSFECRVDPLR